MNTKVFYELWQMECCGKPFKIGDPIEWYVFSADRLIRPFDIEGLVPAPGHSMLKPVPGTSELVEITSSEDVEEYRGELQASGYFVELDEVTVTPAKHK